MTLDLTNPEPKQCTCCDENEGCNEPGAPMSEGEAHADRMDELALRRAEDRYEREMLGDWDD